MYIYLYVYIYYVYGMGLRPASSISIRFQSYSTAFLLLTLKNFNEHVSSGLYTMSFNLATSYFVIHHCKPLPNRPGVK